MKDFLRKTSVVYSISSLVKAAVQMLVGLAIARFISPVDYGIWGALNLLLTYATFLQLGIINGVNLELPIALGEKNNEKVNGIIGTSQAYIFYCILFILIGSFLYITLVGKELDNKMLYGIISIVLIIILTFYQDLLTATFRTPESFLKFSKINLAQAFVNLLTILLIIYFSYYGLLLKSIIVILLYVVLLYFFRPFPIKPKFEFKYFVALLKVGFPIFSLAYILAVAIGIDKILLLKYSDFEDLGIYSFAYLSFASITMLSGSIASYIYPTMSHMYAEYKDKKMLFNYVFKNISMIFIGLSAIGIIGWFTIPYIIPYFFPKYIESILSMKILLIAGVFNGSVIGVNVLLSLKKWKQIIIYNILFSIVLLLCPYFTVKFYSDNIVVAVSIGVLVANFVNFFIGYFLVFYVLRLEKKKY